MSYIVDIEQYEKPFTKCLGHIANSITRKSIVGLEYYEQLIDEMKKEYNIKVHKHPAYSGVVWNQLEFENRDAFTFWLLKWD